LITWALIAVNKPKLSHAVWVYRLVLHIQVKSVVYINFNVAGIRSLVQNVCTLTLM